MLCAKFCWSWQSSSWEKKWKCEKFTHRWRTTGNQTFSSCEQLKKTTIIKEFNFYLNYSIIINFYKKNKQISNRSCSEVFKSMDNILLDPCQVNVRLLTQDILFQKLNHINVSTFYSLQMHFYFRNNLQT